MHTYENAKARKQKRRSRRAAFWITGLTIASLFIPIHHILGTQTEEMPKEEEHFIELTTPKKPLSLNQRTQSGRRRVQSGPKTPKPTPKPSPKTEKPQPKVAPTSSPEVHKTITKVNQPAPSLVEENPKPTPAPPAPTASPTPTPTSLPTGSPVNGSGSVSSSKPSTGGSEGSSGQEVKGMGTQGVGQGVSPKGLFGRKALQRPMIEERYNAQGKVRVLACVNKQGRVVSVEVDRKVSSTHRELQRLALDCAKRYQYEADPSAPTQQCGYITFVFTKKR